LEGLPGKGGLFWFGVIWLLVIELIDIWFIKVIDGNLLRVTIVHLAAP